MKSYTIVTCGTAGHVYPALTLVEYMIQNDFKVNLIMDNISGAKYISNIRRIQNENLNLVLVPAFERNIHVAFNFSKSIQKAHAVIRDSLLVIGFVAGLQIPILCLCVLMRVPFILHEQDSVLNKTNRIFKEWALHIFTSFKRVEHVCGTWIGCPLVKRQSTPQRKEKIITILAGTNGSDFFDVYVSKMIGSMKELKDYTIYHGCRNDNKLVVEKFYDFYGVKAVVGSYFPNYEELIQNSDFLITRGGASTISYLELYKKNAIIIPWPDSSQNHQYMNAKRLNKVKGIFLLQEKNLSLLPNIIKELLQYDPNFKSDISSVFKSVHPQAYVHAINTLLKERGIN